LCEPRIRKPERAQACNRCVELLHIRDRTDAHPLERLVRVGREREDILQACGAQSSDRAIGILGAGISANLYIKVASGRRRRGVGGAAGVAVGVAGTGGAASG